MLTEGVRSMWFGWEKRELCVFREIIIDEGDGREEWFEGVKELY